ncbi:MAG TPA: N-6 DNA methylase [Anaerolineae bacterium]|nr:N-6 DNA methylase [Anaerolineae bacterium]
MAPTFEHSREQVAQLVQHYRTNRTAYHAASYKEAHVRQEFIDPLFVALGWDVHNAQRAAPDYREVTFEGSVEIGGQSRAPDYVFRVGRDRKFFVEAKKPGVSLKTDSRPAYQLRSYAWSAKLPLSLLTDFEELAVYDCRFRPAEKDKATVGCLNYYEFEEYPDRWREVWDVFSREAVWGGSFDQYAQASKARRGTSEVDSEFLKEIEGWRDALARNLALRNQKLTTGELNDAVQRTIDRIIFLRMAEDRGVEEYEQLRRLAEREGVYAGLIHLSRRADSKYNSGLFDFSAKGDTLTPGLFIDDKVLKPILANLYYPQSPYRFNLLPVEILGNVYEQFLGKVIRLTPAHQAKVEEKPEVKKAGGVYYTPDYIVKYIVQNTVGKLIEGKSPKQLRTFRVVDIACGSGSFLLGAYQCLLDYYLHWYIDHDLAKHPDAVWKHGEEWRLTVAERKRILTTHIFGVDIDRQAVEVTKLSLLLKVLEGESDETLGKQLAMFPERALPNLDANIKCGNSLIGPDYFAGQLMPDADELRRVNPFDWWQEFPEIMKAGGFDCVIGNPPYIRIQTMKEWAPLEVELYKQKYVVAGTGNYDIYVVFVEKGLSLLNKSGRLGFILPHKFFNSKYGEPLRRLIAEGRHLEHVVHFGDQQVFVGATTYTTLMFLDKAGSGECRFAKVDDLAAWRSTGVATEGIVLAESITAKEWNFAVGQGAALFEKLSRMPVKLENVTSRIFQGIKTGADKIYICEEIERKPKRVKVYSKEKDKEYFLEPDLLHPLIKGGDSRRYHLSRTNRLILFPYELQADNPTLLLTAAKLKARYPLTWAYLVDNEAYLENRENGKLRGSQWYAYSRSQALDVMPLSKIFTPDIAARSAFSVDDTGEAFFTGGVAGGYGILVMPEYSRGYILGLLNSKLLEWYLRHTATQMRGGYYSYESRFIRGLPIRTINFSDPADKTRHDKMVLLVEQMLELHKRLSSARTQADRELHQRQIDATDRQIDALVYELYELTPEEIKIVEDSGRKS